MWGTWFDVQGLRFVVRDVGRLALGLRVKGYKSKGLGFRV